MNNPFAIGDHKKHRFLVGENDVAEFDSGLVHPVCSTFKLAKEMEWSSRLFVLEMCEAAEEGVGTSIQIKHISPAFVGEQVELIATYESFENNELICSIEVKVGERLIATGKTGQKILSKEKINKIFSRLEE